MASYPKLMEKSDEGHANPLNDLSTAPSWLLQYLAQMKHDIKKEIIEELLSLPQIEVPGAQSAASEKEECNLPFQGEVVHYGIYCDNCDQLIHGIRYKCGNCSDFDLCQECESLPNIHNKNHIFLKIRYPVALKLYQKQKWQQLMAPVLPGEMYSVNSRSHTPKKLYEAKFVCDETVPDGTVLAPGTKFIKTWRVTNSGKRVWTHATKLQHIQGSAGLIPASEQVDVPHLKPGEEGSVSVLFTTPIAEGVYRSHWNFCHKSRPFGHIVWCHIIVKDPKSEVKKLNSTALEKPSMPLIDIQSEKGVEEQRKEVDSITQVLTAVKEEHERGNMVPRKLVVSSHTATPNNTPFDLTPPKSPDHHETSVKERKLIPERQCYCNREEMQVNVSKSSHDSDNEDECSVVSLSSCESDTEFVVIPMPKCFNLSESFVSHHMPHLAPYLHSESDSGLQKPQEPVTLLEQETVKSPSSTKVTCNSETVSQETGVPELSEHIQGQSVVEISESNKNVEKKILVSHIIGDGSSSEISIIESEDSSPLEEHVMPTIDSISIAVSNDANPKPDIVCEVKYPVTEVKADCTQVNESISTAEENKVEEQNSDIPCSATFPKFPVEGVTSTYEPVGLANHEERTIQVLPEGLVTGALSAAASVYNTARAVINTIQQPRNERGTCLSQELPNAAGVQTEIRSDQNVQVQVLNPMEQLAEMGFCNRQQNEQLLQKHNGDVALVVAELVNLNDNDWYASRHVPSSPSFLD